MYNNKYKEHIIEARKLLTKKNLSTNDLEMLECELNIADYYNDFKNDYQLLNLYGKYYLAKGDIKKAKRYFNLAIKESPNDTPIASYYGLFKVAINEKNYKQAIKELALYDSCFSKNFNMKFYFKCLNRIFELKGKKINYFEPYNETYEYINCSKAPRKVLNLYKKAETFFDNHEYKLAYKMIEEAQKLCVMKNYSFDFTALMKIISQVHKVYMQSQKQDNLKCMDSMDSNSEKKAYLKELIKNPVNVPAMIKLIEILISEEEYDEAYSYLNHQMDQRETNKYIKELNLLRKKLCELYNYKSNEVNTKSYIDEEQVFIDDETIVESPKQYQKNKNDKK